MDAHCRNAATIAGVLPGQPTVRQVYYPGLSDHPGHEIAARQMSGFGGMLSFETHTEEQALDVCRRTKLFFLAESLGGVESLIEHPARMTHLSVAGSPLEVSPTLVRLSVGIEHPDDLVEDLLQALG
jgi:cystathionine gamma-synthase